MGRMQNITEEGRYYSGYDGRVHSGEPDFYVSDQIWDTFRSAHPLRLLIDPRRELDMIRSYVRMFTQSGWLPRFPRVGGDVPCMLGHHTVATIVDAYRKGLTDFDVDAGLRRHAQKRDRSDQAPLAQRTADRTRPRLRGEGIFPRPAAGRNRDRTGGPSL